MSGDVERFQIIIIIIIIIGLFNIAAKGWIEQYAISRM